MLKQNFANNIVVGPGTSVSWDGNRTRLTNSERDCTEISCCLEYLKTKIENLPNEWISE